MATSKAEIPTSEGSIRTPYAEWFVAKPAGSGCYIGDFSDFFISSFGEYGHRIRNLIWSINHFIVHHRRIEVDGEIKTFTDEELFSTYDDLSKKSYVIEFLTGFSPLELLNEAHKLDYYPLTDSKQSTLKQSDLP